MLKSHKQNIHYNSHHGCVVIYDYNKSQIFHFSLFSGKTNLPTFIFA